MWQYGFILGLWLSLAIIFIPWGYIVSEPLLALRSRVEDLIYLSQGLRDHPTRLLYRIIPGSLVLFLKGRRKHRCNMQLHTCQTVLRLVVPQGWSTEGNAFKCILYHGLLTKKKSGILSFAMEDVILWVLCLNMHRMNQWYILNRQYYWEWELSSIWVLLFEMLLKFCWSMNLWLITASTTFWHEEIASFKQRNAELLLSGGATKKLTIFSI